MSKPQRMLKNNFVWWCLSLCLCGILFAEFEPYSTFVIWKRRCDLTNSLSLHLLWYTQAQLVIMEIEKWRRQTIFFSVYHPFSLLVRYGLGSILTSQGTLAGNLGTEWFSDEDLLNRPKKTIQPLLSHQWFIHSQLILVINFITTFWTWFLLENK